MVSYFSLHRFQHTFFPFSIFLSPSFLLSPVSFHSSLTSPLFPQPFLLSSLSPCSSSCCPLWNFLIFLFPSFQSINLRPSSGWKVAMMMKTEAAMATVAKRVREEGGCVGDKCRWRWRWGGMEITVAMMVKAVTTVAKRVKEEGGCVGGRCRWRWRF